jgi:transposase-like protein
MARKTYNDELRTAATELVREQGYCVKEAAQSLSVDQGSIRDWVRKYAPAAQAPAAAPAEDLRREVQRLRWFYAHLLREAIRTVTRMDIRLA